jgi:hypothetical protein
VACGRSGGVPRDVGRDDQRSNPHDVPLPLSARAVRTAARGRCTARACALERAVATERPAAVPPVPAKEEEYKRQSLEGLFVAQLQNWIISPFNAFNAMDLEARCCRGLAPASCPLFASLRARAQIIPIPLLHGSVISQGFLFHVHGSDSQTGGRARAATGAAAAAWRHVPCITSSRAPLVCSVLLGLSHQGVRHQGFLRRAHGAARRLQVTCARRAACLPARPPPPHPAPGSLMSHGCTHSPS